MSADTTPMPPDETAGFSRRRVIGTAAAVTWATPIVAIVGASPAFAASPGTGPAVLVWNTTPRAELGWPGGDQRGPLKITFKVENSYQPGSPSVGSLTVELVVPAEFFGAAPTITAQSAPWSHLGTTQRTVDGVLMAVHTLWFGGSLAASANTNEVLLEFGSVLVPANRLPLQGSIQVVSPDANNRLEVDPMKIPTW